MAKRVPYELPDDQCERLKRSEMQLMQRILALASDLNYAKDDLKDRLACVPSGQQRMNMLIGGCNALFQDLIGTVSDKQRRQLKNTAKDYYIDFRPRMMPNDTRVTIDISEVKELTEMARSRCATCTEDGETARKCKLYRWLEGNIPLNDYGDGLVCPYATIGWEE